MAKNNKDKKWDEVERRGVYQGKERRAEFDHNCYARISALDNFDNIGVFRINSNKTTFGGKHGQQAWAYDRRDENYQKWMRHYVDGIVRMTIDVDEENVRERHHRWDSQDLTEEMYIG